MKFTLRTISALFALMIIVSPVFAGDATWLFAPATGDWSTAANWTPPTVPNSPADTATFSLTTETVVSTSANTEVEGIVFDGAASPYTIIVGQPFTLTLSGTGITNNSGITQSFVIVQDVGSGFATMEFTNSATAGIRTFFQVNPSSIAFGGGLLSFFDDSTAGMATILNLGGSAFLSGGRTVFNDDSTAGSATIINDSSSTAFGGGSTTFNDDSTAGSATITNNGGSMFLSGGFTNFFDDSSAGMANITNNGGSGFFGGGNTNFFNDSTASNATIITNGSSTFGAGAVTQFFDDSTAGSSILIANGGSGQGGGIYFTNSSTGGTSQVRLFDNGFLDISQHNNTGGSPATIPDVTIGSLTGDSASGVFLGSNNLAVGSIDMTTTFAGTIQDGGFGGGSGGSFSKVGQGTLFLTGTSTYTGDTNVFGGGLIVNGSIGTGWNGQLTRVAPGALLGGIGTVNTDVGSRGIVSPGPGVNGQGVGTLTVGIPSSSYASYFNDGGTFRAEIGGLNAGVESDLLDVIGHTQINGGTKEIIRVNDFNPAPGDRVTIIDTTQGFNGTFATLVPIGWLGLIQPTDAYTAFTADIVFVLNPFVSVPGLTENQNSVAEALDEAFSDECLPLSTFTILGNIPVPHLPSVYDLIAPEELAAMYEISFSRATVRSQNLQRRMDQIRDNAGPNCGPIVELAPQPISDKNVAGKDVVAPAPAPAPESRWGTFAMGSGDFVTVHDDDGNADGYKIANGSFLGGVDYRLLRSLALGIYGGYVGSNAELNHHGRITTDGGTVGGYATYFAHGFYVQGAGGGTWNEYQNQRTAFLGSAQGHTNGDELNAMGAAGYDWSMNFHAGEHDGSLTIGPIASIQYTDLDIDGYSEHGSLIPLEIQGHSEDSLKSTIGAKAMVCLQMPHGAMLRPEVRVAWLHEYSDNRYAITSRFIGCEGLFRVHGPRVGEDAALVNGGLTIQMTPMLALFGHYDGIFGRDNYDSHSASGGLALSF